MRVRSAFYFCISLDQVYRIVGSHFYCCFCVAPFCPLSLDLHNETLRWENYGEQPKSICSEPCPAGHVHNHQDICCWTCVKCREEFEFVNNDTCISCQPGWAPNERKNGCDKLKVEVIDWLSPWAYVSKSAVDFLSWKTTSACLPGQTSINGVACVRLFAHIFAVCHSPLSF